MGFKDIRHQSQYDYRKHYKLGEITFFDGQEYKCVDEREQYFECSSYIPRPPRIKAPDNISYGYDSVKVPKARVTTDGVTFNAPAPIFFISMFAVAIVSALIGAYFG